MPKKKTKAVAQVAPPPLREISIIELNSFLIGHRFNKVNEANDLGIYEWDFPGASNRELAIQIAANEEKWEVVFCIAKQFQPNGFIRAGLYRSPRVEQQMGLTMLRAAKASQLQVINELVKMTEAIGDTVFTEFKIEGKQGYGALHYAVANNNLAIAQQLVAHGFSIHKQFTCNGVTLPSPLELCLTNKNLAMAELLINNSTTLLPLLSNKQYQLDDFTNQIITKALAKFNAKHNQQYLLSGQQWMAIKGMLLNQLLANTTFIKRFLLNQDKENILNQSVMITDLADHLETSFGLEPGSCYFLFHKKKLTIDTNYLFPHNLVDELAHENTDVPRMRN